MGEYININEVLVQLDEKIKQNEEEIDKTYDKINSLTSYLKEIQNKNKLLKGNKEVFLAQLGQSEIAHKFITKHKDGLEYKYAGKMDSPQHGFANCNRCLVPLELFKGNTGIGEVEIGVCPKCMIEVDFTDYSKW